MGSSDQAKVVDDEVTATLRRSRVFGGVATDVLSEVAAALEPRLVRAGEVLVRQGEKGDCVYFLVSGRLRASAREGGDVEARVLGDVGPGEMVGELALLTDLPRTASVTAVRDSEVLRLPGEAFETLVRKHPDMMLAVSRQIVERMLKREPRQPHAVNSVQTIAVLPAGDAKDLTEFCRDLAASLSRYGSVIRLNAEAIDAQLGVGASRAEDAAEDRVLMASLHQFEREHRYVIYQTDESASSWTQRCVRQADRIVLVGYADGDCALTEPEELLSDVRYTAARRDLVLLHDRATTRPSATSRWLAGRSVSAWFHVRKSHKPDHDRVSRAIVGREIGLVLGGGGPRGFAHLGALRAIDEAGIPIDVVGGTSIGSIMGAAYAMGWDHSTRLTSSVAALSDSRLLGLTLPVLAMSSARKLTAFLRDPAYFGDVRIEDLWTSYFCVSANLTRAEVMVHERGELWRAVRASISLPGVMPPVYQDGDLLVDGGVMNNLPVDVMQARIDGGFVIAIDLEPEVDRRVHAPFDVAMSGWHALMRRVNPLTTTLDIPSIVETILRSKEVGGHSAQRKNVAASAIDLWLRPPTDGFGALDFKASQALIDVGYEYTKREIESWPLLPELV